MISIKIDAAAAQTALAEGGRKAQRSLAIALTKTAGLANDQIKREMPTTFDRPTPFTLNGTVVRPARYNQLTASVVFKDYQSRYLLAEVTGGQRRLKRFELALQHRGVMPKGWFAVPADGVALDAFGNLSRGVLAKIIAQLGTELLSGYQNTAKGQDALQRAKRKNGTFFAIQPGNKSGLPAGIYQRIAGSLGWRYRAVLIFVQTSKHTTRLRLDDIGQAAVSQHLQDEFNKAFSS